MPTDFVLFIHGVKTHNEAEFQKLARTLLNRINPTLIQQARTLKPIFFFWGDLNLAPQKSLKAGLGASSQWKDFWFRDFRTEQVLEFVGDAVLYISRFVGSQVVLRLQSQVAEVLNHARQGDRLHLITHSWGTVILFDILFAARWEDSRLEAETLNAVQDLRQVFFGLSPNPTQGVPIASGVIPMLLDQAKQYVQVVDVMTPPQGIGGFLSQPLSQTILPIISGGKAHGSYWESDVVARNIGNVIGATR